MDDAVLEPALIEKLELRVALALLVLDVPVERGDRGIDQLRHTPIGR
jgi:hypothetical protein